MAKSLESGEPESMETISVKDEGATENLVDETGRLKDEEDVTVVAGSINGERVNKKVDEAAAKNDAVAVELGSVEGGLTDERVTQLLKKNRAVQRQDAELVVRGVDAEQDAAIRQLRAAGIRVETSQQMRRSAGLDASDQIAA